MGKRIDEKNPEITLYSKENGSVTKDTVTKVTRENPLKTFSSLCQIDELIHQCNLHICGIKFKCVVPNSA